MDLKTQQLLTTDIYNLGINNIHGTEIEKMVILDSPIYINLSDFLFKNNQIKYLVYCYLNLITEKVLLSELIDKFGQTSNLNFYKSEKFKTYMANDKNYKIVISTNVTNPYKWCELIASINGYVLDSKILKDDKYRELMIKNLSLFIAVGNSFHHGVDKSAVKKDTNKLSEINTYYNSKRAIESELLDNLLVGFDGEKQKNLSIDISYNTLEFTNFNTNITLFITFDKNRNVNYEILDKSRNRDTTLSVDEINKIISFFYDSPITKYTFDMLRSKKMEQKIKRYFVNFEKLKMTDIFTKIHKIVESIIIDLKYGNEKYGVPKELFSIYVGHETHKSVSISLNNNKKLVTLGYEIFGNENKSVKFKKFRYTLKDEDFESSSLAENMILKGLIFFNDEKLNKNSHMESYVLKTGQDKNFAGVFMRPPLDKLKELVKGCENVHKVMYNDYFKFSEPFQISHGELLQETNLINDFIKTKPSSYLEYVKYIKDPQTYISVNDEYVE